MSLSIVIPTYNRKEYIKELIPCFTRFQKEFDIEIIICDNASTDGTTEYIHQIQNEYRLVYYRSDKNFGPDYNFLKGLSLARKSYVTLFSSDDLPTEKYLQTVFQKLAANPDLVLMNLSRCDKTMKVFEEHHWLNQEHKDFQFYDASNLDAFFEKANPLLGVYFGYITSIIFKTSRLKDISLNPNFKKSFFSFSYYAYKIIIDGGVLGYIRESNILNRGYNDSVIQNQNGYREKKWKRLKVDLNGFDLVQSILPNEKVRKSHSNLILRNYTNYSILKLAVFSSGKEYQEIVVPFFSKHGKNLSTFFTLINKFRKIFVLIFLFRDNININKKILPNWILKK